MANGGIAFITAHVFGSNNNFETRDLDAVKEFFARNAAIKKWLKKRINASEDADAIVIAIHANIFRHGFNTDGNERWPRHSGFRDFGRTHQKQAKRFGKPVLLVFGDTDRERVFMTAPILKPAF